MENNTAVDADASGRNISLSLETRIKSANRIIRDATRAALKFVQTEETVIGGGEDGPDPIMTMPEPEDEESKDATMTSAQKEAEEFDLAMILFGDDARGIEEDINSKLTNVEYELFDYFERKEEYLYQEQRQGHHRQDEKNSHMSNSTFDDINIRDNIDYSSFGMAQEGKFDESTGHLVSDARDKTLMLETEARQLTNKIKFLKKCSEARMSLEDVTDGFLKASVSKGAGQAGTSKESGTDTFLVDMAHCIRKAKKALAEAEDQFQSELASNDIKQQDAKAANDIMYSIKSQIRRWNVDVHSRACETLSSCITIEYSSISIYEAPTPASTSADNSAVESGGVKSKTKANNQASCLKVALDALAILSEESQEHGKLECAITNIAHEFLSLVLRPVVLAVKDKLEKGEKASQIQAWEFYESQVQRRVGSGLKSFSSHFAGGTTLLSSSSRAMGIVSALEWKKTESESDLENTESTSVKLSWWLNLLEFIQRVTQFFCDKVLTQRDDIGIVFGRAIFGSLTSTSKKLSSLPFDENIYDYGDNCPIIQSLSRLLWDHCIPESSGLTSLDEFASVKSVIEDSTQQFEAFLKKAGLIRKPTLLAKFGTSFGEKYNEKVRTMILGQGRSLLIEGDYLNSTKAGVNLNEKRKERRPDYLDHIYIEDNDMAMFLLEECAISKVGANLFDLCKNTMDLAVNPQASMLSPLLPATLFRSSRELLDLFRAVIPASHGSEISTIPRSAAIFHNTCVFFAHKMLTFGLEYRDKFLPGPDGGESPLKKMCTFLDLVPIFRELADRTMNDMIQHQKLQVSEIISPRITYLSEALGSDEGVVEWTDAETALTAGLYHLRHLSQNWKNVLSYDVYSRTIGCLADSLFTLYLDKVFAAKDISVAGTHFVGSLFRDAVRGVTELFLSTAASPHEVTKEAKKFSALEDKFSAVGKFMDMSLQDISMGLSAGVFRETTGVELSRLVIAIFEDTEARAKILRLLGSSQTH